MKKLLLILLFALTPFLLNAQELPKSQDYTVVQDSLGKVNAFKNITLISVNEGFVVDGETPFKGYLLLPLMLDAYSKEELTYMIVYNQLVMANHAVRIKR